MKKCLGFNLDLSVDIGVEIKNNLTKDDCVKKGGGNDGKYGLTY